MNLGASQSRTLNESKPKAQHEFSERDKQRHLVKASQRRSLSLGASQFRTLNESKPKAQHEFSERNKQST